MSEMDSKSEPERPQETRPDALSRGEIESRLRDLRRSGEISDAELRCLAEFSDIFTPSSARPLDEPVGRRAFEQSIDR